MSDSLADSHSFTIVSDEKDWLSASWLLTRHRWLWKRLIVVSGSIWLLYCGLEVLPDGLQYGWHRAWILHGLLWGTGITLAVIAIGVALACGLLPFRVRKLFRDASKLAQSTQFTFDAKGLRTANQHATTTLDWLQFERWLENDRILLLIVMQRSYYAISKSQVAPHIIDALRSALIAARVPHR
ncbi:YcxB family protein [Novosphingobium terrae]|uniref:YcxB family protein n=1 Tax=Novosphingobium terrae TaxID=2726189 RepID=UPI00197EF9D6|nr:YcxB family protein [Novosphingobium terrae]